MRTLSQTAGSRWGKELNIITSLTASWAELSTALSSSNSVSRAVLSSWDNSATTEIISVPLAGPGSPLSLRFISMVSIRRKYVSILYSVSWRESDPASSLSLIPVVWSRVKDQQVGSEPAGPVLFSFLSTPEPPAARRDIRVLGAGFTCEQDAQTKEMSHYCNSHLATSQWGLMARQILSNWRTFDNTQNKH